MSAAINGPRETEPALSPQMHGFLQVDAQMQAVTVSTSQWARFLDSHIPRTDVKGESLQGRALTTVERKRDILDRLYRYDQRAAPWAGTAQGVLKAVKTYEHHEGTVRGALRPERNMLKPVTGDFGRLDRDTYRTLTAVLT